MKVVRRSLLTILSVISLALLATTVVSWIFAEVTPARVFVSRRWEDHRTAIDYWIRARGWNSSGLISFYAHFEWEADPPKSSVDPVRQTLQRSIGRSDKTMRYWSGTLPIVPVPRLDRVGETRAIGRDITKFSNLTIAFAMLPLIWVVRQIYRRRKTRADPTAIKCEACGYDMRATPDRCPECGRVREKHAAARSGP